MTGEYYRRSSGAVRIEGEGDDEWIESDGALDLRQDYDRVEGESPTEWIEVQRDDVVEDHW